LLSAVLIVLITASVYSPVIHQGFFNWDDPKHVRAIWKPGWERAWRIATDFKLQFTGVGYYSPLHFLSLMTEQAIFGDGEEPKAWIPKVMNVAYHAANACLLFLVLILAGTRAQSAFIAALVFALHPIQVGTVAWIVERKNLLATGSYLLALIFFFQHVRTGKHRYGWLVVIVFLMGLLSKPTVVTLPVVMALGMVILDSCRPRNSGPLVIIVLLCGLALLWGTYVLSTEISYPGILPPWYERPLLAAGVVWFYIAKFVWPVGLVVVYPRWDVSAHVWEFSGLFLALCLAVALVIRFRRTLDPVVQWGLLVFLVNVAPVSGLLPFGHMGHSFVADHLAYLPLVGLAIGVGGAADALELRLGQGTLVSKFGLPVACGIIGVLGVLSVRQVMLWDDTASLWEETLRINQTSAAVYHNYGAVCMSRGELEKALPLFQKASQLAPNLEISYNNMGKIYAALGQRQRARQMFEKSLQVNPRGLVPLVMLGRMLRDDGNPDESLHWFQKVVAEDSLNPVLRLELAEAYSLAGREEEALRELDGAIRLGPMHPDPHVHKARILLSRGELDQCIDNLQKALNLGGDAEVRALLGTALARKGKQSEALQEFLLAYSHRPNLPGVADSIANLLMDMNEFPQAKLFCENAANSGKPCGAGIWDRLQSRTSLRP
jgi:protein O-mannosyl-transferase